MANSYNTVADGLLRLCSRKANHASQSTDKNYEVDKQDVNDRYKVA